MGTPHLDVERHQKLQHAFAREMALALKHEVRYLNLPADERRSLLWSLTFMAMNVLDNTPFDETDGTPVEPRLVFIPEDEGIERVLCGGQSTYLHELMPSETDDIFDCEKEE
jgi:hypothetical protein